MLRVLGASLEDVRGILDAEGSNAQVTELPDGVLNQTIEVSRIVPGTGSERGWAVLRLESDHSVTGDLFTFGSPYDAGGLIESLGGSAETHRAWAMYWWTFAEVVGGNAITATHLGFDIGAISDVAPNGGRFILQSAVTPSTLPIISAGGFVPMLANMMYPFRPVPLFPNGVLFFSSRSTVAATSIIARAEVLLWIGKKGQNPPSIA